MNIENANHIYGALRMQGLTVRAWSLDRGFNPRTVQLYIQLFAPCTGRRPKKPIAVAVMKSLSDTLGVNLTGKGAGKNDNI